MSRMHSMIVDFGNLAKPVQNFYDSMSAHYYMSLFVFVNFIITELKQLYQEYTLHKEMQQNRHVTTLQVVHYHRLTGYDISLPYPFRDYFINLGWQLYELTWFMIETVQYELIIRSFLTLYYFGYNDHNYLTEKFAFDTYNYFAHDWLNYDSVDSLPYAPIIIFTLIVLRTIHILSYYVTHYRQEIIFLYNFIHNMQEYLFFYSRGKYQMSAIFAGNLALNPYFHRMITYCLMHYTHRAALYFVTYNRETE